VNAPSRDQDKERLPRRYQAWIVEQTRAWVARPMTDCAGAAFQAKPATSAAAKERSQGVAARLG
jgi:hypothetical protein